MRKRSRIALTLLLLAVIGGIAWLSLRPNEPMYKGRRLSDWLDDYVNPKATAMIWREPGGTDEILRSFGTNAIPTLLRRLRAKDSPLKLRLVALVRKQHLFKYKFTSAWEKQQEGMCGFRALGANGKDAVPELIKMYEKDDFTTSRYSVTVALSCIGPAATEAVPMLVRTLRDNNANYRGLAAIALHSIHAQPKIALPALIKCLSDHDDNMRRFAAEAIGAFGSDARQALPELQKLLSDSDANVREAAKNALKRIDPEAAAKVEGK